MSLKTQITEEVKNAMRAGDKFRLQVLRMLTAGIKQREVDEMVELSDDQVLTVIEKMIKQRRDAAGQFQAAGRPELADKENLEIKTLSLFLPEQFGEDDIIREINTAISKSGAAAISDMGKVMALLKHKLHGRADMGMVSKKVREKLTN